MLVEGNPGRVDGLATVDPRHSLGPFDPPFGDVDTPMSEPCDLLGQALGVQGGPEKRFTAREDGCHALALAQLGLALHIGVMETQMPGDDEGEVPQLEQLLLGEIRTRHGIDQAERTGPVPGTMRQRHAGIEPGLELPLRQGMIGKTRIGEEIADHDRPVGLAGDVV